MKYEKLVIFTLGIAIGMFAAMIANSVQPKNIHLTIEKPLEIEFPNVDRLENLK